MVQVAYTAEATATGTGRDGHVRSSDGRVDLTMAPPKEMGGSGEGSNPEQLFAAGYSACFLSAMQVVARRAKADLSGATVTGEVGIGPDGNGGYGLAVTLKVSIPTLERDQAQDIVEQAHQVCPYSNATRGNIDVDLVIA